MQIPNEAYSEKFYINLIVLINNIMLDNIAINARHSNNSIVRG